MRSFALPVFAFLVPLFASQAQAGPVGSFAVMNGPEWDFDPPTYSCVETCALLFGGSASDYSCSTSDASIDHQAFVDGYDEPASCATPVAEDFKQGASYACGVTGCSYSAYVADHDCGEVNYCWPSCVGDQCGASQPTCGNGVLEDGEQCDDGNTLDGDCCSASCQLEPDGSACGDPVDACSGASVCSAGACVAGGPLDCDDGNRCTQDSCDPSAGCVHTAAPAPVCDDAAMATLTIDQTKGLEGFSWMDRSSSSIELGSPDVDTGYALCVYDGAGALVQGLSVDGGTLCEDGRPCWKVLANRCESGVLYHDDAASQDGVQRLAVMSNKHGMTRAALRAKGDAIRAADLGAALASPVRAQLVNDAGACFEATFDASEQWANGAGRFVAKHGFPAKHKHEGRH